MRHLPDSAQQGGPFLFVKSQQPVGMQFPDDQEMNGELPCGFFHGFKFIQQGRKERMNGDMPLIHIMHGG